MADAGGAVPPHHARAGARAGTSRATSCSRARSTPAELAEVIAEIDPFDAQTTAFLETRPDGKLFIARAGQHHVQPATWCCARRRSRDFCAHRVFADLCHDLIGPDVRLYWDQAVYKKPEKPRRRSRGTRTTATRFIEPQQYLTCWVAAHRRHARERLPLGRARPPPPRHARALDDAARLAVLPRGVRPGSGAVEAPAGSIVVFSSLTPHRTGAEPAPAAVRKAYIVQFAPEGARAVEGDAFVPQDDPARQFFVLRDGQHVPFA